MLMPATYSAIRSSVPGMVVLDQFIMMTYAGFWGGLTDLWLKLVGLRKGQSSTAA